VLERRAGTPGPLIIIGGGEDREGERVILREFAQAVNGGRAVLATIATEHPDEYVEVYRRAFADLPIGELALLHLDERAEARDPETLSVLDGAAGIFFTGGDQLRISSQVGGTPLEDRIRELWLGGGVLAGTSAGASVMSDIMLVAGSARTSYRIGDLRIAAGLGVLRDAVIDQHFAERGRFGRLLGAVAHSPRVLGIGIDEDTAIVVRGEEFAVIGSGAVYVFDADLATRSNVTEARPEQVLSIHGVRLDVLVAGERFDLDTRRPIVER
jgi:cyanophycinase